MLHRQIRRRVSICIPNSTHDTNWHIFIVKFWAMMLWLATPFWDLFIYFTVKNLLLIQLLIRCPQSIPLRKLWLNMLSDKCDAIEWKSSRICSNHFEHKYFDNNRQLKDNAIPTKFNTTGNSKNGASTKMDTNIEKLPQKQLLQDVRDSLEVLDEPSDIQDYVTDDLKMSPNAPIDKQLWFIIKKQNHLMKKLMNSAQMYKNYASIARKELEQTRTNAKNYDKNLDTQKYLVKCLQERQATLEKQIQIITAVESTK